MDAGGGTRQVEKLSNRYGARIFKCNYISEPEEPFGLHLTETRINVDRTWIIETLIDLMTQPSHPNFARQSQESKFHRKTWKRWNGSLIISHVLNLKW